MKLSEVNPPLSFYICENHFSGSCFDDVKGGIKDDAIPTLKPVLVEYEGGSPNDSVEKKKSFVEEQIGSYMCRVCSVKLDDTDNMIFIFDESKRVFEKMKSCLPVIVEDGNDLPHHICEKCFKQLERMYIIRSLAICTESLYFHYLTSISTKENDHTVTGTATIEPEKNKYWVEEQLPLKGPVTCNLCNTEFVDMEQFDLHTEEHVAGSSEEPPGTTLHVACSSCGLIFEADSTYKEHKRSQKYECVACDVILYSYCEMKSHECIPYHVEDEEEEDKPFENDLIKNSPKRRKYYCSPCNRQFQRQVNWVKHKTKHERDELFFECKECDLQFHTVRLLSQHREKCHKNSQNWICRYCGKHTTTKLSLNIHERIHTGVKPFICEWCGNAFRSKANLSQHHAKHTGIRRHSCNVCGKKFSRKSFVTTHMRVHTGERPFACDICEQRFTQVGDMRRHRRRHIVQQHQQQQQSQSTVGGILIQQVILKDEKCDTDSTTSIIENSTSTTETSLQLGSKISIADIRARFL